MTAPDDAADVQAGGYRPDVLAGLLRLASDMLAQAKELEQANEPEQADADIDADELRALAERERLADEVIGLAHALRFNALRRIGQHILRHPELLRPRRKAKVTA